MLCTTYFIFECVENKRFIIIIIISYKKKSWTKPGVFLDQMVGSSLQSLAPGGSAVRNRNPK